MLLIYIHLYIYLCYKISINKYKSLQNKFNNCIMLQKSYSKCCKIPMLFQMFHRNLRSETRKTMVMFYKAVALSVFIHGSGV